MKEKEIPAWSIFEHDKEEQKALSEMLVRAHKYLYDKFYMWEGKYVAEFLLLLCRAYAHTNGVGLKEFTKMLRDFAKVTEQADRAMERRMKQLQESTKQLEKLYPHSEGKC